METMDFYESIKMETVKIGRRVWTIRPGTADLPNVKADLIARGFDGIVYNGKSNPFGKQRKLFTGIFYRVAKTGEYLPVAIV